MHARGCMNSQKPFNKFLPSKQGVSDFDPQEMM